MRHLAFIFFMVSCEALAEFTHESELSTVTTGGNTDVQTYLTRTSNKVTSQQNVVSFGGHYTYGESSDGVNARDWDISGKYEKMFSERFAYLVGEIVEGWQFQGIKARYNSDIGIKYYFIRSDDLNLFSELGYRYTLEDRYRPEPNQWEHKGRLYGELNHKPSETFQYRLVLEYVPNFTNPEDYIINGEASITSILTSIFSVKVSYRGIYDDQPAIPGNKNYDYVYSTSFVAKF